MKTNKTVTTISANFDFSKVPSWYVLCTNKECPLKSECMRFMAGSYAPDDFEYATCIMPKTLKDGKCRWFDKITIEVWAAGFTRLYDRVLKSDYTEMRKAITRYLHGAKMYYEYKRGERVLSAKQQQWIRDFVKSYGYDWEVEFDRYFEDYVYQSKPSMESEKYSR
jgi:hypothetical protein